MKASLCSPVVGRCALALLGGLLVHGALAAPDEQPPPAGTNRAEASPSAADSEWIRSFLHLQEQVHETQLSIERSRVEAEQLAARTAQAMDARLRLLEKTLDETQKLNADSLRETMGALNRSNERMLTLAVAFAGVGFLALLATAWLQWRTVNRMAMLPALTALPPWLAVPGQPDNAAGTVSGARLMETLGRLEQRLNTLEPPPAGGAAAALPTPEAPKAPTFNGGPAEPAEAASATAVLSQLLREGEELLAQEEVEKAIARFDTVLEREPAHTEALLRKGIALERLQRNQEAIECYDRAIAADQTLTMAYLYKGGLFNRMERFTEAMACYEKALRIQESRPSVA